LHLNFERRRLVVAAHKGRQCCRSSQPRLSVR
jgi:hypothetical protein